MIGGLNKLLVEPYTGKLKPRAKVESGFATIEQRSNLVGLKLLADAVVSMGQMSEKYRAGSMVFFKETDLATMPWTKTRMTCAGIEGEFIIADYSSAVAIDKVAEKI